MKIRLVACVLLALMIHGPTFANDAIDEAINAVLTVEKNGKGHAEAAKAMKTLRNATKSDIPRLLSAIDRSNEISANWLRAVIIATNQRDGELPVDSIQTYFMDSSHSHMGRLMAFELLNENSETFAEETIPKLASDPSLPLKRMGIDWYIKKATDSEDAGQAIGYLGFALDKARDLDQVDAIAEQLGERGVQVDLQRQLGFINSWHLVGTFDNKDEGGFDVAYGPEKDLNNISVVEDKYQDHEGNETKWFAHPTVERTGVVDLVKGIGPIKGVTAYAYATFNAEEARTADIRVGCINAHKVWVNGKLALSNEVYHNGMSPDKFSGQAELVEGENIILVKICQNEQTQPWAQMWQFQLRICDETGKAIMPAEVEETAN